MVRAKTKVLMCECVHACTCTFVGGIVLRKGRLMESDII